MNDNILEFKKPTSKPKAPVTRYADCSGIEIRYGYDPKTGVHALQIVPADGYTDIINLRINIMSHKLAFDFGNSILIFDNVEDSETFRKFHPNADFELVFKAPQKPRERIESLFNKLERFLGFR